jgi:hypothetical protein
MLLFGLPLAVILEPVDRFSRWWRPYPPPCENGTCVGGSGYVPATIPDDVLTAVAGLSPYGRRCRCGDLYTGGTAHGLRNRWVRVLPNGAIRPYLKHGFWGRWRRDNAGVIEPGLPERAINWWAQFTDRQIPGWAAVALTTALPTGAAVLAISEAAGLANPIAPWLVGLVALLGFITGCVILWIGPGKSDNRNS